MQPINLEAILPHLWISGRSSRAEWWRVHIICAVLATMLEHMMFAQLAPRGGGGMQPISLLWPIASLALMWVSFASVVRRFHDRGKSGWWALLYFVPVIGWLWILIECGFLPGKAGNEVAPAFPHCTGPTPASACRAPRRGCRRAARRHRPACRLRRGTASAPEARRQRVRFVVAAAAAFMLYKMMLDPNPGDLHELGPNGSVPVFEKP